jgi:hypothetical protein
MGLRAHAWRAPGSRLNFRCHVWLQQAECRAVHTATCHSRTLRHQQPPSTQNNMSWVSRCNSRSDPPAPNLNESTPVPCSGNSRHSPDQTCDTTVTKRHLQPPRSATSKHPPPSPLHRNCSCAQQQPPLPPGCALPPALDTPPAPLNDPCCECQLLLLQQQTPKFPPARHSPPAPLHGHSRALQPQGAQQAPGRPASYLCLHSCIHL